MMSLIYIFIFFYFYALCYKSIALNLHQQNYKYTTPKYGQIIKTLIHVLILIFHPNILNVTLYISQRCCSQTNVY